MKTVSRPRPLFAVAALLVPVVLIALGRAPRAAAADDPDTRAARAEFQRAEVAYRQGRFEQALTAYQAAYDAKPLPGFLFNLAQCHRNLGNDERALYFYRRYLAVDPNTTNRPVVEQLIADAEKRLAAMPPAAPASQPSPAAPRPPAEEPPPRPSVAALAPPPLRTAVEEPPPRRTPGPLLMATSPGAPAADTTPVHRRWWFWATIGGVVAAGTITALMLSHGTQPPRPTGDLGALDWH